MAEFRDFNVKREDSFGSDPFVRINENWNGHWAALITSRQAKWTSTERILELRSMMLPAPEGEPPGPITPQLRLELLELGIPKRFLHPERYPSVFLTGLEVSSGEASQLAREVTFQVEGLPNFERVYPHER